jgi:hypothetical protein
MDPRAAVRHPEHQRHLLELAEHLRHLHHRFGGRRAVVQHVGDAGLANRQVRYRSLEQDLGEASLPGDREELIEKHIARAEQESLLERLGEVVTSGPGNDGLRLHEEVVQLGGDVRKPTDAAADERIKELEHTGVVADGPQDRAERGRVGRPQPGQPQNELAHLGVGEGTEGKACDVSSEPGDGEARGEKHPAATGSGEQASQVARQVRIEERGTVAGQVLLEVVENDEHGRVGKGLRDKPESPRVIEVRIDELLASGLQPGIRSLEQRVSDGACDRPEVPGAHVRRDEEAVFGQAPNGATGHGALADATHTDERERRALA